MRENRPYGSEGGKITNLPDPYQVASRICRELRDVPLFLTKRNKCDLGGPHLAGRDKFGD